ncbi:HD-GYP domain-containing protein [Anaerobacillus sp. MEB173]|uniref:HD-GYP domain-containing protein n=1 Tax=Anaerobacillus sp. MEB173 TaxID=3383345 RepID=UPI003F914F53
MFKKFDVLLYNPIYFRYGFFILLLISIVLNGFIIENNDHLFVFYILCTIFLGIGFYNKPTWFIIMAASLVVISRFFLIPEPVPSVIGFLVFLFTYLLITFISVGLMKNVYKIKKDSIELTTALSNALDSRDSYTKHHSEKVATYAVEIAEKMNLSKKQCEIIRIGSLLHDIGKIGIPESILNKPGKLTDEEYNIIKSHPVVGYEMIKHVESFKHDGVLDIVLYHHERYDGKGYPSGLKGEEIPLFARIVAVADTFDAMSSKRIYRKELSVDYVLNEMAENKGLQFDPEIMDVFLSNQEQQRKGL